MSKKKKAELSEDPHVRNVGKRSQDTEDAHSGKMVKEQTKKVMRAITENDAGKTIEMVTNNKIITLPVSPWPICACSHHRSNHSSGRCTTHVVGMGPCDCDEFRAPAVVTERKK